MPPTTSDYSFLAICPGLSLKDTAIIASQWAASKVQRCVRVCVNAGNIPGGLVVGSDVTSVVGGGPKVVRSR